MNNPLYSVVIPVYNSTATLPELVQRLDTVFNTLGVSHEVIFVDDASPHPESWAILKELATMHDHVHSIQLVRNFGKAGAVLCGMRHAAGQWVITIDDDLQHAPEDIPSLLEKQEHDIVIGAFTNKKHSVLQKCTSLFKGLFDAYILNRPRGIRMSPFKLFKASVIEHMLSVETTRPFIPALMLYTTRDIVQVNVTHHPRQHGKSSFSLGRRWRQFSNLLFGNSSLVLRFIAFLGVSVAAFSLLYGLWLIMSYFLHGRSVPGWTSLMVITLMLGGLIMFSVGVIGEYLIRIIERVERRPAYLEREIIK